jgi:hypothetical protein
MGTRTPVPGSGLVQQAAITAVAGVAMINGTQTFLTWNVPNDGKVHFLFCVATQDITVAATGGAIQLSYTLPDGTVLNRAVIAGNQAVGANRVTTTDAVQPGTTVTLTQNTAMTAGAGVMWGVIYGQ